MSRISAARLLRSASLTGSRLALGVITGLALALRVWGLGASSITHDEAYGLWVATRPLSQVLPAIVSDVHPPLYYLLLHFWLALGPPSDAWARLPSALAGTALAPATYALGRRWWNGRAGLIAALLAALSPLAVAQAREARMYPLVVLLLALAAYALLRASPQAGKPAPRRWWFAYVLLSTLALYTHYYAAFVLAAFTCYASRVTRHASLSAPSASRLHPASGIRHPASCIRHLASCILHPAIILVLYLPWLPAWADQFARVRAGFWIPPPSPGDLGQAAQALGFFAVTPRPPTATLEDFVVRVVGATGVMIALLAALLAPGRRRLHMATGDSHPASCILLVLWLAVPVALAYAVSLIGPSVFEPRYFAVCLPAFWLLVARGVIALPGRALQATVLAGLILASLASLYTLATCPAYRPPAAREAAAWLQGRTAPGDLVVHTSQFSLRPMVWYNGDDAAGVLADDPALPPRLATAPRIRLVVHYDVRVADGPRQADAIAAQWAIEHGLWDLRTVARFWGLHIYEWTNSEWTNGRMNETASP